jgi:hypothetical protein
MTLIFNFADEPAASAPPPASSFTPAPTPTRELSPDEEFALSLDSFGSMSNTYNDRAKSAAMWISTSRISATTSTSTRT